MKNSENLSVGQKVWVNPTGRCGSKGEIFESTISKVGRKYFEVKDIFRCKFCVKTLEEVSDYSSNYIIYTDIQDYEDEKEHQKLSNKLKKNLVVMAIQFYLLKNYVKLIKL